MSIDNRSLKENKEDKNITFISFDNKNVKESINNKDNTIKENKNIKSKIIVLVIITLILLLYIISSIYNNWYLENNTDSKYKVINKLNTRYAIIKEEDRHNLFKKIGYIKVKNEKGILYDKVYDTTYAYRTNGEKNDYINVYYEKDKVKYVMICLTYKKEDYSKNKVFVDANNILNNFINFSINVSDIDTLDNDKSLSKEINDIKLNTNMMIKDDYYIISLEVK